jgi:hypothetical protein
VLTSGGRHLLLVAVIGYVAAVGAAGRIEASPASTRRDRIIADDVKELTSRLRSEDVETRPDAAETLSRRGQDAGAAAVALALAATDADEATREWAVAALEGLGPPPTADVPALAEMLAVASPDFAYWAATLIGRAGGGAALVVNRLEAALKTRREPAVRERIVWALGEIGPPAAPAAATLEAVASEADCPPRLARLCRNALESIHIN